MVEITSPGLLPPSIDYAAMENRQSDARNKVIAPVFKRLGIDVGNVGIPINDSEVLLIELIRQNSKITAKEIADTLKLSKRQCERIIADLKNRGILSRKGTNRTGYWVITGL